MQKKMIIPALAVIVGLVLTTGISAFKKAQNGENAGKIITDYFQYEGADEMSGSLTNAANWSFISTTLPSSSPCPSGTNLVCVAEVPDGNLSGTGTKEQKFASFLNTVSGGAVNYVDTHTDYQKH